MDVQQIARQYRANAGLLELRIVQLQYRMRKTNQPELCRRLRRRIGILRVMMGEGRRTGYDLEHYYDRPAVGG